MLSLQSLQYEYQMNPSEGLKTQVADQKRCLNAITSQLKSHTELDLLQVYLNIVLFNIRPCLLLYIV